jgi:GntR family transcriptional regulator
MLHALKSGPTALYGQLASIFRSQILGGAWQTGTELPTIDELCDRYGVSRITVRQAIQILVEEGLLISGRGRRTTVSAQRTSGLTDNFKNTVDAITSTEPDHEIVVLERKDRIKISPDAVFLGTPAKAYARFNKIHRSAGAPYAVMEIYIAQPIADRFPKKIETRKELAPLLTQYAKPKLVSGRERITIAAADYEEARHLEYPMAGPVAKITRIMCNAKDEAVYVGHFTYRGDRFGIERSMAAYVRQPWNSLRSFR